MLWLKNVYFYLKKWCFSALLLINKKHKPTSKKPTWPENSKLWEEVETTRVKTNRIFFFYFSQYIFSVLQEIKKQPIQRNQLNLTIFFSNKTTQIYSVGVKKLTFSLIFSFCLKVDFCENNYICTAAPPKYESRLCVYYLTSCCKLCCLSSRFVCF